MTHAANRGKISALPYLLRKELCFRKRDGATDIDLALWLNSLPEVKAALVARDFGGHKPNGRVSPQNLSEYFRSGGPYEQWRAEQAEVENTERRAEFFSRLAEVSGGAVSRPSVAICAAKLMEEWERADADERAKMVKALTGLSLAESAAIRSQTDRERLAVQKETAKLDRDKFRHLVANDALRMFEDAAARGIAEGGGSREEKIRKLVEYMEKAEQEQ